MASPSANKNPPSSSLEFQIRRALQLSQRSVASKSSPAISYYNSGNDENQSWDEIEVAQEAITAWEIVLYGNKRMNRDVQNYSSLISRQLPTKIKILGHVFYGHALARCGRDKIAEKSFEEALLLVRPTTGSSLETPSIDNNSLLIWNEAGTARGRALQRLLRYREAKDQFEDCIKLKLQASNDNNVKDKNDLPKDYVQNIISYVTCSCRLGEVEEAVCLLEKAIFSSSENSSNSITNIDKIEGCEDLYGLYAACIWMENNFKDKRSQHSKNQYILTPPDTVIENLEISIRSKNPSPLYKWLYLIALVQSQVNSQFSNKKALESKILHLSKMKHDFNNKDEAFLRLAAINQCAFDTPHLLQLDHKVHLHNYLTTEEKSNASNSFWPVGYIFPKDLTLFRKYEKKNDVEAQTLEHDWILKQAAGYGSHGNRLVTAKEAYAYNYSGTDDQSILCQKVVHPPLLLGKEKKKFSLRVYAVLIPSPPVNDNISQPLKLNIDESSTTSKLTYQLPWQVFLSSEGLMKLASSSYDVSRNGESQDSMGNDASNLNAMHMTNSGRESDMQQYDFRYLKQQFQSLGLDYNVCWSKIELAVKVVMTQKWGESASILNESDDTNLDVNNERIMTAQLYFPKILGFDFIISEDLQPWLLEVNRFPGLEPRDESDYEVKHRVVKDAWAQAAFLYGNHLSSETNSYCALLQSILGLDLLDEHSTSMNSQDTSLKRIL